MRSSITVGLDSGKLEPDAYKELQKLVKWHTKTEIITNNRVDIIIKDNSTCSFLHRKGKDGFKSLRNKGKSRG